MEKTFNDEKYYRMLIWNTERKNECKGALVVTELYDKYMSSFDLLLGDITKIFAVKSNSVFQINSVVTIQSQITRLLITVTRTINDNLSILFRRRDDSILACACILHNDITTINQYISTKILPSILGILGKYSTFSGKYRCRSIFSTARSLLTRTLSIFKRTRLFVLPLLSFRLEQVISLKLCEHAFQIIKEICSVTYFLQERNIKNSSLGDVVKSKMLQPISSHVSKYCQILSLRRILTISINSVVVILPISLFLIFLKYVFCRLTY